MFILDWPLILFIVMLPSLWLATWMGTIVRTHARQLPESLREDYGVILGATLTLLGLIIGFTFSMAITRYDLRKSLEAAEANAIGTEYDRLDFLPAEDAVPLRALLRRYTDLRIRFYVARRKADISRINADTEGMSSQLWGLTAKAANSKPSALSALAASGMNEVLNSKEFTQAARWNRIPPAAWLLMLLIAALSNLLLGYGAQGKALALSMVLPLVVSICFLLIADIDSPVGGVIRVHPQNLYALAESLKASPPENF
jgi:hypothetical protein